MSTLLLLSNIPTTLNHTFNHAFNLNQACLIATSLFLYEVTNIYFCICNKENMQDPVRLNILCILTNVYNKNQVIKQGSVDNGASLLRMLNII